jgi:PKD repeat protein
MNRTLRFATRFALPALAAGLLLVLAQVVFAQPPVAGFIVTPPANNCGAYTFTSTATDPDNDIDTIAWDFGDGGSGSGSPVQHTFAPGNYTVTQTVTDMAGGDDLTVDTATTTQGVNVANSGQPTADVNATPNPAQPNATVTLNAGASTDPGAGGGITKYEWDLNGDNVFETNTGATATTTTAFATTGFHTVRLRVTDNCGAQAQDRVDVFVNNTAPTASWNSTPSPGKPNEAMTFNASASSDAGGSIASYTWSWGDGTPNTTTATATTQHTFATAGSRLVTLTVTDNDGASSPANTQLVRVNAKPTASFSETPNPSLLSTQVTFDASSSTDDTGIATYQWDFDGDGTFDATGATATNTYATPGTFNVKLRVTDNDGDFTDLVRPQIVQVTQPTPGFSFTPANPLPGQTITLTSSSAPSNVSGHAITDTQWDFDYSPLSDFVLAKRGKAVTTSFATPGAHTVAVKVVETGGGFAVASRTITVNAPPRASFTVRPSKPVEGQDITFLSTSSDAEGPLAQQAWDLDNDGKYDDGSGAVASTKKLKKGTHQVHLRVTDSKGATSIATVPVKVGRKPLSPAPDILTTYGWSPRSWGTRILYLYVEVPKRTNVRIRCSGHGCPSGKFLKRSGKRATTLRFTKFAGSLHSGARVTVIGWRSGSLAEYFMLKVRGGNKAPLKVKRCKALTAKKYHSCG